MKNTKLFNTAANIFRKLAFNEKVCCRIRSVIMDHHNKICNGENSGTLRITKNVARDKKVKD